MASYLDRIAQRMGISADDAQRFVEAARTSAGNTLAYRDIYRYLEDGRWSGAELRQMADAHDIVLDPMAEAVLGTAHILGTTTAEAEEFIENVDDHFPEPVNAADIWQAVQTVEPTQLTVRTIIAEVENTVIARELSISPEEARELAQIIGELIGVEVNNRDILDTLRAAEGPPSVDRLLDRLAANSTVFVALAAELDATPEDARQFAATMHKQYPWATDADVLEAVRLLPEPERRVQAICSSLETLYIGRALDIDRKTAVDLPRMIAEETDYPLTKADIIAFITHVADEDETLSLAALRTICAVAQGKRLTLPDAVRFVSDVRYNCELPATDADIQAAFASTREPQSVESVAATLRMNLKARRFGIDLDELSAEVQQTIQLDVSRAQLYEMVSALGPDVTSARIIEILRERFATILFIAGETDINPAEVGELVGRLQRLCGWPVTDEDVAQALQFIPGAPKTIELIRAELEVLRIAESLHMTQAEARSLPASIVGLKHPVSNNLILEALDVLDPHLQTADNVTTLIRLADALDMGLRDVLVLRDQAERELATPVSLAMVWHATQRPDRQVQNIESIMDYLMLEGYFHQPERDAYLIDRAAEFLSTNRHQAARFWTLLEAFDRQGNLSITDLDYIRQLASWPSRSLDSKELGERQWLTSEEVQQLAVGEARRSTGLLGRLTGFSSNSKRQQQVTGFENLSRRSWHQIRSAERRYQVPSRGRAEIIASEALRTRLGLHSLRFVQEGVNAPGVFLHFRFEQPAAVGIVRIDQDGRLEGFHQLADSTWFQALIVATALSYYRDLVIAVTVDLPPKPRSSSHRGGVMRGQFRSQPSPRSIPSTRWTARPRKRVYTLADWYRSQEIARHLVRGHTRYIGPRFVASPEKRAQARAAGVTLQRGETWVIEHERGDPQYRMPIELDGVDLTRHTLFSPPKNASRELEDILG